MVGRTLQISDDYDEMPLAASEQCPADDLLKKYLVPPTKLLLMCASLGFLGGVAVAWLLGVFG
jgi:hypothetical protein